MEPKFRSIPITIIDFLAIFLPGFVWLILLILTFHFARFLGGSTDKFSLADIFYSSCNDVKTFGIWTVGLLTLIFSLLIGNILKPVSMETAELCIRFIPERVHRFFLKRYIDIDFIDEHNKKIRMENSAKKNEDKQQAADEKAERNKDASNNESQSEKSELKEEILLRKLKFPYTELYSGKNYYVKVCEGLKPILNGCDPNELSGSKIFSVTKRYIRFASQQLWEESERMEAEVRMLGALWLSSLYSIGIFLLLLALSFRRIDISDRGMIIYWLAISFISSIFLAVGWIHLRHNEATYTYMNALIAMDRKGEKDKSNVENNERVDESVND